MGLGSNVEVVRERAEVLARAPQHRERWPIVTARAVGSLAAVAALGLPLLATGGLLVAWKRSPIEEEMAAAGSVVARLGGGDVRWRPSGLADRPSNVLVTVRKVRPAADAGGRDGAHGRRVRRSGRRLG
jgi:16S rRNA (guanine527-N7)-methyltransferase